MKRYYLQRRTVSVRIDRPSMQLLILNELGFFSGAVEMFDDRPI